MLDQPNPTSVEHVFARDATGGSVLVADGYGLNVFVTRGHLLIRDGLGRHRRERRLLRVATLRE